MIREPEDIRTDTTRVEAARPVAHQYPCQGCVRRRGTDAADAEPIGKRSIRSAGGPVHIIHIALGGCLKAPPVQFGLTADTGGHIAYVLEAAIHQARRPDVSRVEIYTRRFAEAGLGAVYNQAEEPVAPGVTIRRIATASPGYLSKEALDRETADFARAFCERLEVEGVLPDVIHAHFADAASVALEARRRFGIPFVYTPHSLARDKAATGAPGLDARVAAETTALAQADAVIVSSREERDRQVGAYGVADAHRRTVVAPPGPPTPADPDFAACDALLSSLDAPEKPILLAVARPVRKKNLHGLLLAFADSPELQQACNLVILAGQDTPERSGEERAVVDGLAACVGDRGLAGRVCLPSSHTQGEVQALYQRAARDGLFANPALHEPFGLTLLEAARAGAPVVATDRGGPAEIVSRIGHGLLVDPLDEQRLAETCLRLMTDRPLRDRLAARGPAGLARYDGRRYGRGSVLVYRAIAPQPRLLVCDIDGTLTGCRDAARRFARWRNEATFPFVVATGRDLATARRILSDWSLPEPDAFITDVGTAIHRAEANGWARCDRFHDQLLRGWDVDRLSALADDAGLTPQSPSCQTSVKLSYFGDAAAADGLRRRIVLSGLHARVVHSHRRLIDVLPSGGGKARAVHAYAASRGWTLAQCVGAGDSGNDEDMLNACGRAIVVGNGDADLAGLAPRRGLMRSRARHADGVLEALAAFGVIPAPATRWAA